MVNTYNIKIQVGGKRGWLADVCAVSGRGPAARRKSVYDLLHGCLLLGGPTTQGQLVLAAAPPAAWAVRSGGARDQTGTAWCRPRLLRVPWS